MVLSAAGVLLALLGVAGVRLMLEPGSPDSLTELTERIEAAGIECGGVSTADADQSTLVCGGGDVIATYHHRLPTVRYSGSYIPLEAFESQRGSLSGDRFVVVGPYETVARIEKEVGGDLERLSG